MGLLFLYQGLSMCLLPSHAHSIIEQDDVDRGRRGDFFDRPLDAQCKRDKGESYRFEECMGCGETARDQAIGALCR